MMKRATGKEEEVISMFAKNALVKRPVDRNYNEMRKEMKSWFADENGVIMGTRGIVSYAVETVEDVDWEAVAKDLGATEDDIRARTRAVKKPRLKFSLIG